LSCKDYEIKVNKEKNFYDTSSSGSIQLSLRRSLVRSVILFSFLST